MIIYHRIKGYLYFVIQIDFWLDAPRAGRTAKFMVPPKRARSVKHDLENQGLRVEIVTENLER